MQKLTVLIDMDDTIENFCEIWIKFLNKTHGTNVVIDDVKEWDMSKAFPDLSKEELYAPIYETEFWRSVTPLPDSVKYVKQIIDDGHKVVIVTASHPNTISMKLENVLFKYFPFFNISDVIFTSQKQLIQGDVLIDDGPHNLENGRYFKILYDAPHNRYYDAEANGVTRANNWEEVYQIINTIATSRLQSG